MASSIVALDAMLFDNPIRAIPRIKAGTTKRFLVKNYSPKSLKIGGKVGAVGPTKFVSVATRAPAAAPATISDCDDGDDFDDFLYSNTFSLSRTINIEGKIYTRMEAQEEERHWKFTIGCNLPGKWVLRWGVHFLGESESEWDQPPHRMRPPGSVAVKDYAIDTPMMDVNSLEEGECFQEVKIDINTSSAIASINFVLRDEETGLSYQHLGGELRMPLVNNLQDGSGLNAAKWAFSFLQDDQEQPSSNGIDSSDQLGELVEEQPSTNVIDSSGQLGEVVDSHKLLEGFYEEQNVLKEITLENSVMVSVRKCGETDENLVCIETDFLEDVLVHWAICRDDQRRWELPTLPYPPDTVKFKNKALRTRLQPKEDGQGNIGYFTLENDLVGLLFVIRLNDDTWLKYMGNAFFIPLQTQTTTPDLIESLNLDAKEVQMSKNREEEKLENSRTVYTKGLIKNIRSLVSDISSENNLINRSKNNQEDILSEIEKLAAEAYSIFTSPSVPERTIKESDSKLPTVQLHSGTGNGYEILCQGFNWESHESGSWYMELHDKADYLSSLGFTIIWLPPPTESISPEGYMPKDLYNLDSRYGNIDELKAVIVKFHEVGIKVLGDVVLNHRCADYQNHNGVWNIFGGRLNWDDRAVVGDDPHFQGRGNKSSGDNFHAAPNIDHSQDFVRRDITEWMCWLKNEVGYDGWRLDFVRGFWGGYVRDYLKATEPYFAVGEYWDSLSYTYSEMDYDQSAHRQRIIDWINATGGYSGAFDVTTKGVLHSAVGDCQYWRLRDGAGQPPGVVGWWPSRAVTFIENHDTGSTQGHWRFPGGKEMQGYAYILTHPGTPSIFYDHLYSPLMDEISSLIALRRRNKLHCRSHIKIMKAEDKVYAAIVDDKVAMKIGPGHYEPPSDQEWSLAVEGECYKVWETVPR